MEAWCEVFHLLKIRSECYLKLTDVLAAVGGGSVKAEIEETFFGWAALHTDAARIHMWLLVVQSTLKGCVEIRRALSGVITWM